MKRRQLTLKGLMIAIAVIGVGMAVLVKPNRLVAFVLPAFLVIVLLTAILGLLFRGGRKRAFWTGFALFGWMYVILNLFFFWERDFGKSPISLRDVGRDDLQITIAIFAIPGLFASEEAGQAMADGPALVAEITKVDENSTILVAGSVAGLVFAWIGGTIARAFAPHEPTSAPPDCSPSPASATSKLDEPANPSREGSAGSKD